MSYEVTPDLLVIPDGADDEYLFLTLQVTPAIGVLGGPVELSRWPSQIAALASSMRVSFSDYRPDPQAHTTRDCASELGRYFEKEFVPLPGSAALKVSAAADRLWQRIFETPGFDFALKGLAAQHNAADPTGARSGAAPEQLPITVATTRTADLAQLLDAIEATSGGGAVAGAAVGEESAFNPAATLRDWLGVHGEEPEALSSIKPMFLTEDHPDPFGARAAQLTDVEKGLEQLHSALVGRQVGGSFPQRSAIQQIGRQFRAMLTAGGGEQSAFLDPDEEKIGDAKRKLAAILSIPTLAHYFGLAVQLKIPKFSPGTSGLVRVEFLSPEGQPQLSAWTAFEYAGEANLFCPWDGPAGSEEESGKQPYRRGFVDLSARINDDGNWHRRFRLDSRDVTGCFQRLAAAAENEAQPKVENLRRGIALFDRFAEAAAALELDRDKQQEKAPADDARIVLARDLIRGVRPDVAVLKNGERHWRSITHRSVTCSDPLDGLIDPLFYSEPAVQRIAHHDHGIATVPEALSDPSDKTPCVRKEQEMFLFAGETLALAGAVQDAAGHPKPEPVDAEKDLGLSVDYALPEESEAQLPPLREDLGYFVALRLVFANGCSRRFAEAGAAYESDPSLRLGNGDSADEAFPYRSGYIPPPTVHFEEKDPLVVRPTLAGLHNDAVDHLVVRTQTDRRGEKRVVRLLLPSRIGFDKAEAEGQFDSAEQRVLPVPAGAFMKDIHLRLFGEDGALPEARLGSVWHVEAVGKVQVWVDVYDHSGKPQKAQDGQSRGTVAIFSATPDDREDRERRYYASLHSGRIEAVLIPGPLSSKPDDPRTVSKLWNAAYPRNALPLAIELVRSSEEGVRFNPTPLQAVRIGGRDLPHLRIDMGECEEMRLELRAAGDPNGGTAPPDTRSASVTLVHARKTPRREPSITWPSVQRLGVNAVSVTVRQISGTTSPLPAWSHIVAGHEQSGLDMLDWPSAEGGSITFFVGRLAVDRKSVGHLKCVVEWEEYAEGRVRPGPGDRWTEFPSPSNRAFDFDVEPTDQAEQMEVLDLLHGPIAARAGGESGEDDPLRHLQLSFPDGRARRLTLTFIATSRFARYFADSSDADGLAQCTKQSEPIEVWTECTYRPTPPRIDRLCPVFNWETERTSGANPSDRTVRTANRLRFYLDEDWYSSGEGEQLAILLSQTDSAPDAFAPWLTRVVGDPLRPGAEERGYLTADDFPAHSAVPDVTLFRTSEPSTSQRAANAADGEDPETLKVTVVPLSPQKDEADGSLYCEVEIAPGRGYTPFIHFGLARYQAHAVEHLRLSHAISFEAQLLPWRIMTVSGSGTRRVFRMEGPGYAASGTPALGRSSVDLHLLQWDNTEKEWIAPPEELGVPASFPELAPQITPQGQFSWDQPVKLPRFSDARRVALLIEEFEHLPSEEPTGEYRDGQTVFRPTEIRRLALSHFQPITRPG